MHKGLLLVNEGPDGSGKETQTRLLCDYLEGEGYNLVKFSFPTYKQDPVADLIRFMLHEAKDDWNTRDWRSKAVLYASNRLRFAPEMRAALEVPGNVVICDRFVSSNQGHMGALAEDPTERLQRYAWIDHLEFEMMGLPRPDVVLLHTMPSEMRAQLLMKRENGNPDAHEGNSAYLDLVEQSYYELMDFYPEVWRHIPADMDGRLQTPDEVHGRVKQALLGHQNWIEFVEQREPAGIQFEI
ncbi:MAG: hypothetical protein Q7S57_05675 [bacterium]|nr:hypothetical protein [bacterium]